MELNPQIDHYLVNGCMRCKYGGTPQCKINNWKEVLKKLRQIVIETGLKEELKWGVPVYTYNGKNIVNIAALKNYGTIGFFKGVLLSDTEKLLSQQGNLQSNRIIKLTDVNEVERLATVLKSYIAEAIEIETSGKKVTFKQNPEPIPQELLQAFEEDPAFKSSFYALTPGRQRGYIIDFSQPKKSETRKRRIELYKQQILNGLGFHDR